MRKSSISITLDNEVMEWVSQFQNISEKVNQILKDSMNRSKSPEDLLLVISQKKEKILEEEQRIYDYLLEKTKEGNKIEKEKADSLLRKREKDRQDRRKILQKVVDELKQHVDWKDFVKVYKELDTNELMQWACKFQDENIKVGVYQLKDIFAHFTIKELK